MLVNKNIVRIIYSNYNIKMIPNKYEIHSPLYSPLYNKFNEISYQKIVIGIAGIIFFITMVIFWYLTPEMNKVYPPVMSNCPTGWSVNDDGTCNIPPKGGTNLGNLVGLPVHVVIRDGTVVYTTNPKAGGIILKDRYGNEILGYSKKEIPAGYNVNTPQIPVVDFTTNDWGQYGSVLCANYDWAVKNNIEWEGITNYNQC